MKKFKKILFGRQKGSFTLEVVIYIPLFISILAYCVISCILPVMKSEAYAAAYSNTYAMSLISTKLSTRDDKFNYMAFAKNPYYNNTAHAESKRVIEENGSKMFYYASVSGSGVGRMYKSELSAISSASNKVISIASEKRYIPTVTPSDMIRYRNLSETQSIFATSESMKQVKKLSEKYSFSYNNRLIKTHKIQREG